MLFKEHLQRLFVRYTAALIFVMLLVFFLFMLLAFQLFIVRTNETANQSMSRFFSEQHDAYRSGIETLADATSVKKALTDRSGLAETYSALYQFCLNQPIKANFALLDAKRNIVATDLYQTNQFLLTGNRAIEDIYLRLERDPDYTYDGLTRLAFDNGQKSDWVFAKIVRREDGEPGGLLLLSWREESIAAVMREQDADISVVTDNFNNVLFATSSRVVDSMGKYTAEAATPLTREIGQNPYYIIGGNAAGDMKIFTLISVARQQQVVEFGLLFLFVMSCILLLLAVLLAGRVTEPSLAAVDELLHAVNECQKGNIHYTIQSKTFVEFQKLYDEFNAMTVQFQQQLLKNDALNERKRLMEVKHLEGQFNPHFTFNVLEALRYVVLTDPPQAAKMVVAFANLMRYSINYGSTHVLLKTDIGYVQDYLLLQKIRYGQRLTYSVDIEESLLACKAPKLLIQPIVENSIVHGMEKASSINVRITGRQADGIISLCVEDNGPGMDDEALQKLRMLLEDETAMPEHIGLYNVHRAARLLYGAAYGIEVESPPGGGLRVRLNIPAVMEEHHE